MRAAMGLPPIAGPQPSHPSGSQDQLTARSLEKPSPDRNSGFFSGLFGAKDAARLPHRILQAYRAAAERKLKIFTSHENVALAREALRTVLAEGRLILRPDVANARFEGSLVLSHEEFFEQKQIDIKLVAGVGFEPTTFGL